MPPKINGLLLASKACESCPKITHIAIDIECLVPKITPKIEQLKANIAHLTHTQASDIGITATTGEGLTAFGRGEGIQVLSIISVAKI
jgi:2-C-methyl-D-erythritol 2,4-cyclodiphosphate synthase